MTAVAPKPRAKPSSRRIQAPVARRVLTWTDGATRARALRGWRRAVMDMCAGHSRVLSLAWALEWLVGRDGHATATNNFLAKETGVARQHIDPALKQLEMSGLIVRKPMPGRRRQIFPSMPMPDGHHASGHMEIFDSHQGGKEVGHRSGGSNTENKYTGQTQLHIALDNPAVLKAARLLINKRGKARRLMGEAAANDDADDLLEAARLYREALYGEAPGAIGTPAPARIGNAGDR